MPPRPPPAPGVKGLEMGLVPPRPPPAHGVNGLGRGRVPPRPPPAHVVTGLETGRVPPRPARGEVARSAGEGWSRAVETCVPSLEFADVLVENGDVARVGNLWLG